LETELSRSLLNMTSRLNSARVEIEDLLLATSEVHKLPVNDRGWEARLHLMVRLFPGESDKPQAIECRIDAMNELLTSGALPGWAMPLQPDGSILVSEPVWKATASEPLLLDEHNAFFDKESFVKKVLELAEPNGHA
jgi:hypothetical protein